VLARPRDHTMTQPLRLDSTRVGASQKQMIRKCRSYRVTKCHREATKRHLYVSNHKATDDTTRHDTAKQSKAKKGKSNTKQRKKKKKKARLNHLEPEWLLPQPTLQLDLLLVVRGSLGYVRLFRLASGGITVRFGALNVK
jgi:hypothetical protein